MAITKYETVVASLGNNNVYGDGRDGSQTIASGTTVTLTSDTYYQDLTVQTNAILLTNGFRVFVRGTLNLYGYIGNGTSAGAEPTGSTTTGTLAGTSSSTALVYSIGGSGERGTAPANATQLPNSYRQRINSLLSGQVISADGTTYQITGGVAGAVGASGAAGTTYPAYANTDTWPGKVGTTNAGGAGAAGGYAPNANSINAPGGKGNTGYTSTKTDGTATGSTASIGGAGGAGGAGGVGGSVVLICARVVSGTGKIISRGVSGATGSPGATGTTGSVGTAGSATAGPGATAYNSTAQRGTSGVDLVDGHQAPTITIHVAGSPTRDGTHHTTHAGAYHHHHHVGRNLHSYSNNVSPNASRTHSGHHSVGHYGHNTHFYTGANKHNVATTVNPSDGLQPHINSYAYARNTGYGGFLYGGRSEPAWALGFDNQAGLWVDGHAQSNHHTTPHHTSNVAGGAGGSGGAAGTAGAASPAPPKGGTGATGARGGVGGGGGIILITETTPTGISYDTLPGQTVGAGAYAASSGYTYIVLNA